MARQRADVTDAELAVLEVLWDRGPSNIRRITDLVYPEGGTSSYATVQKLLERLEGKGWIARRRQGRAHEFRARLGREDLLGQRLRQTAEKLCGGSLTPLLTHLVGSAPLSREDVEALRALVERLDREGNGEA